MARVNLRFNGTISELADFLDKAFGNHKHIVLDVSFKADIDNWNNLYKDKVVDLFDNAKAYCFNAFIDNDDSFHQVIELVKSKTSIIKAIKIVRERTNCTLLDAEEFVEKVVRPICDEQTS